MARNIILSILFVDLIISIILLANGITSVNLGNDAYVFIGQVSREMEEYSVQIPNIPEIQQNYAEYSDFINALIGFVNFLVKVVNFVILIINSIIKILTFIIMLIKNVSTLIYGLMSQTDSSSVVLDA